MKTIKIACVFILALSLILSPGNLVLADTSNTETNISLNAASAEDKEDTQAVSPVLVLFTAGTAVLLGGNVLLKKIKNPSKSGKTDNRRTG
ncbi:MAG: hypothetical protein GYA02_14840 [Clostridiaceae bacterium]|nr:hypothetical protein [Clostridiaceae bacterium]